ncbi:MAG TPA: GNAT family N-acetyltransferase, partial [candidate division Zixibacteria bacterium]|nr:GNAT family N-acetyltransferase [candidate division Zixibacteria bacterium]
MDVIEQLGSLALATRLRRLADRLQRDVSQVYRELNVEFEARWFAVVYYLKDHNEVREAHQERAAT